MIEDVLSEKRCFKLVCGAGNENAEEVKKLVALYSAAGCTLFDLCAKPEIVKAAKEGLAHTGITQDRYLCVSLGIKGDPHVSKAFIDTTACISCGTCQSVCPRSAIAETSDGLVVQNALPPYCARGP